LTRSSTGKFSDKLVIADLKPMLSKQIAHAQGIDHFFLRNEKTKQFEQVKDPILIEAALNSGDQDSYYWIFHERPIRASVYGLARSGLGPTQGTAARGQPEGLRVSD